MNKRNESSKYNFKRNLRLNEHTIIEINVLANVCIALNFGIGYVVTKFQCTGLLVACVFFTIMLPGALPYTDKTPILFYASIMWFVTGFFAFITMILTENAIPIISFVVEVLALIVYIIQRKRKKKRQLEYEKIREQIMRKERKRNEKKQQKKITKRYKK